MKISSVSKKVLASALSAAMVVAFAPTVAFGDTPTFKDDAEAIAAGATVKVVLATSAGAGEITAGTTGNQYYNNLQSALDAVVAANSKTHATVTVLAAQEAGNYAFDEANTDVTNLTIDLGGFELTNDLDGVTAEDASDDDAAIPLSITAKTGVTDVVIKNGTITAAPAYTSAGDEVAQEAVNKVSAKSLKLSGINATGEVEATAIDGGTYGAITGNVAVTKTVTAGKITGNVDLYGGADLTVKVETTKADTAAVGITAGLDFTSLGTKGAKASVTAISAGNASGTNKNISATAIDGLVTGIAKGAELTATAIQSGSLMGYTGGTAGATAVKVAADEEITEGKVSATATANEGNAVAVLVGTGANDQLLTVGEKADVTATASTADVEAKAYSVKGKLTAAAGTYVGDVVAGAGLTGGTYSFDPKGMYDAANYVCTDNGDSYTVSQAKGFHIAAVTTMASTEDNAAVKKFVEDALEAYAAGEAVPGITLAEGVTGTDLIAQAGKTSTQQLRAVYRAEAYVEARATDAQKAAYAAINEYNKKELMMAATDQKVMLSSLVLEYTDAKTGKNVTMATVTDLGTKVVNRKTVDNAVQLVAGLQAGETVVAYTASTVAPMARDLNAKGEEQATVSTAKIPAAYLVSVVDTEAVKDAAQEKPEAAPEKATQSIDVAQKSKTVKLAKGKTKTQKAVSFKLGASAETELSIAKKSGSSRITVSGQKVTLKKGTKKGTFTAKVSLKAASSDEFLAAAKTITVKFVVKK